MLGVTRRVGLTAAMRVCATLAIAGLALLALSYAVLFPDWLAFAFAGLAAPAVVTSIVLCRPYLVVAGRGHSLGRLAGRPPRWVLALFLVGVTAVVIQFLRQHDDPGNPARTPSGAYVLNYKGTVTEVSHTTWLDARRYQTRVLTAFSTAALYAMALWCGACARGRDLTAPPRRPHMS